MYQKLSYHRCSLCIEFITFHLIRPTILFLFIFNFFIYFYPKYYTINETVAICIFPVSAYGYSFPFSKCVLIVTDQQKCHKKLCAVDLINLKRNSYSLQYYDDKNLPYLILALLWILRIWIEINTSSVNVLWWRQKTYIQYVICFCLFLGRWIFTQPDIRLKGAFWKRYHSHWSFDDKIVMYSNYYFYILIW